jgi:hypothetical protein
MTPELTADLLYTLRVIAIAIAAAWALRAARWPRLRIRFNVVKVASIVGQVVIAVAALAGIVAVVWVTVSHL